MPRRMASYALSKFTLSHHLNNISPVQQTPSLSFCTLLQASPVTRTLAVCAPRIHGPALTPQLHNLCSECQKWAVSLYRDKKNKNYRYWCDRIVSSSGIQDRKHRHGNVCNPKLKKRGKLVGPGTSQELPGQVTSIMSVGGAGNRWQAQQTCAPIAESCGTSPPSPSWLMPGWAAKTLGVVSGAVGVLILNLRTH